MSGENRPDQPGQKPGPKIETGFPRRALAIVGIVTRPGNRLHVSLRPRLFYILFGMLGLFIVAMGGLSYYSTTPSFCNSCHIMEPYYKAWKTSSHNFVSCVECHYPPSQPSELLWHKFQALSQVAKYLTRTYSSRPYAEIEDTSCLRSGCHSTRLLQGRAVSDKGIIFDHQPHLEDVRYGQQLRCVSCHSQIVVGRHMEVTWDTCYLCHLKGHKGERGLEPMGGCQGCHFLPDKEIKIDNITFVHKDMISTGMIECQACHRDAARGEGEVFKDRCFICHNQPEKLERFGETDFLHFNHVTRHQTACFHCHQEIKHGMTIRKQAKMLISECSKCHSNTHDLEGEFYSGQGAVGVPEIPSPMFTVRVDCVGCHLVKKQTGNSISHATTFTGSEIGCANCHGIEFLDMVLDGQKMVDGATNLLQSNMDKVGNAMASTALDQGLADKINQKLGEAAHNLDFVKSIHSAHNIYYAAAALRYSDLIINAAAKKTNVEIADSGNLPIISGAFCTTLCHNKLGVDALPDAIKVGDKELKHQLHIKEGLACVVCHDLGPHKQAAFKGEKTCRRCHSEEQLK